MTEPCVGSPGAGGQSPVEGREAGDRLFVSAGVVLQGAQLVLGGVGQGAVGLAGYGQIEPLGLFRLVLLLQNPRQSDAAIILEGPLGN